MVDTLTDRQRTGNQRLADGGVAKKFQGAGDCAFRPRCQYSSHDWQAFLKAHGLVASMSRRGNCYDNAVAESFILLLKRERIRRKTYLDREEARRDVFNYSEMFYNPKRRHGYANDVSPVEFENQYFNRLQSV